MVPWNGLWPSTSDISFWKRSHSHVTSLLKWLPSNLLFFVDREGRLDEQITTVFPQLQTFPSVLDNIWYIYYVIADSGFIHNPKDSYFWIFYRLLSAVFSFWGRVSENPVSENSLPRNKMVHTNMLHTVVTNQKAVHIT